MSQSLYQSTLRTTYLCRQLSKSSCIQLASSKSGNAPAWQTVRAMLSRHISVLSTLPQRNLTAAQHSCCSCRSMCKPKLESLKYRNQLCNHIAKFSSSALSWSPVDEDDASSHSEESPQDTGLPILPPAETVEELRDKYKRLRKTKKNRAILYPELAKLIVDMIWPEGSLAMEKAMIIETSPGPGILTKQLLNSGAPRVLSMEREKPYLPSLSSLASKAKGRLKVMHADFFAMHYHGNKKIHPPVVRTAKVFEGVEAVPWEADVPIKVIGSLPQHNERTHAYIIASQLLERLSSFKYGRVQFNVLMSEGCYNVISQPVGNMFRYRALSALMQMSCHIELLHKEPQLSFRLPTLSGEPSRAVIDKDLYLCLVRLTPKRDLFTQHQLSQQQAFVFVYFVRQVLAKRRQFLFKMIEAWAPGHGDIVHEFGYDKETLTGNVEPTDLLRIYMAICPLDSFNGSWMGEDVVGYASKALEDSQGAGYHTVASRGIQL